MLSICIPVYNVDVTKLVTDLLKQTQESKEPIELIIIDDASDLKIKSINRLLSNFCQIIELETNVGRSKIRNLFVKETKNPYLLFLDCDSEIVSPTFISSYLAELKLRKPNVLFGGSIYQEIQPEKDKILRWKTSRIRESKALEERNSNFNSGFKTNNFIIEKALLEKYSFNEKLKGYGHEDTLFAFELSQSKIQIYQCNNPVLNAHLDSNEEYLKKTDEAIKNLAEVLKIIHYDSEFIKQIPLLKNYFLLKNSKLLIVLKPFFWMIKPSLNRFLKSGIFFLWMFDLYKLIGFTRLHVIK